jgi:hypothetical protein
VASVPAHADTLAQLPRGDARTYFIDYAGYFVSGNAGILNPWQQPFFGQHVAVADAASLHLDADLPCSGLGNLALDQLEIRPGFWNHSYLHCCHF